MKNTFLKKAGAVALAAVMAVTFAPVASFDVFAADTEYSGSSGATNVKEQGDNEKTYLSGQGEFKLSGSQTGDGIVISGANAKVTIELNGHDAKIKEITQGAVVVIKSTLDAKKKGDQLTIPTLEIVNGLVIPTGSSLRLEGNMYVNTTAALRLNTVGGGKVDIEGVPTADLYDGTTVTGHAIGLTAIQTKFNQAGVTGVTAENGDVSISNMYGGDYAFVGREANAGTTIKASAKKGVTLQKYETTYSYYYSNAVDDAKAELLKNVSWTENSGKNELSEVFYKAGTANGAGVETQSAIAYKGSKYATLTAKTANTYDFFKDTVGKDAKGEHQLYAYEDAKRGASFNATTAITIATDADWAKAGAKVGYTTRNEYYTTDPTADTVTKSGIVVIDGDKYSVTKEKATGHVDTIFGGSTYEVKRNPNYTDKDGSKESVWDFTTGKDAKVTVPKDSSLVQVTADKKSGVKEGTAKYNYISGSKNANKMANDARSQLDTTSNAKVALNVEQLGDGVDTITFQQVDQSTSVTRGEGVGYYKVLNTSYNNSAKVSQDTYTFGTTAKVTEDFNKKAAGYTNGKTKVDPEWKTETVFASKEIKPTVAGVNSGVTLEGEISAKIKTIAADGTKTWSVNGGSEPAVATYRLYDKNRGEHVYTISATERDMLVKAGWIYEGEAFKVHSVASGDGVAIYRVYNPNNGGMHHYTTSKAEVDMLLSKGWTEGKVVFYAADKETGIEVLRTYNVNSKNGEHHYTSNPVENQNLINLGWKAEGVAFYAFK